MNTDEILKSLFESIDMMDDDKFASYLHDDVSFIFGNAAPVVGKNAARDSVAGFFAAIRELSHSLESTIGNDSEIICRGRVKYTRHDGSTLEIPFANYFAFADGLIKRYQIYADISRLFAS